MFKSSSRYQRARQFPRRNNTLLFLCMVFATVKSFANTPTMNGIAAYENLGREQYLVALYTNHLGSQLSELQPLADGDRLEFKITAKHLSKRRFIGGLIERIAINVDVVRLQRNVNKLNAIGGLIKGKLLRGDHLVFTAEASGIQVYLNSLSLGTVNSDPELFQLLLLAWAGDVPPSTIFKSNLLASGNYDETLHGRFISTQHSEQRLETIKSAWLNEESEEQKTSVAVAAAPLATTPPEATPSLAITPAATAIKAPTNTPAEKVEENSVAAENNLENNTPVTAAKPVIRDKNEFSTAENATTKTPVAKPKTADADADADADTDENLEDFTLASILEGKNYYKNVSRHVNQYVEYPRRAMMKRQEGIVELTVAIDSDGKLVSANVNNDPKFPALKRAAEKATENAQPYPTPPASVLVEGSYEFQVNIAFKMQTPT